LRRVIPTPASKHGTHDEPRQNQPIEDDLREERINQPAARPTCKKISFMNGRKDLRITFHLPTAAAAAAAVDPSPPQPMNKRRPSVAPQAVASTKRSISRLQNTPPIYRPQLSHPSQHQVPSQPVDLEAGLEESDVEPLVQQPSSSSWRKSIRTVPKLVWFVAFWIVLMSVIILAHVVSTASSNSGTRDTLRLWQTPTARTITFSTANVTVPDAHQVARFTVCCQTTTTMVCNVACVLYVLDGVMSCHRPPRSASCVLYLE
jgi:hypothetical protein